MYRTQQATQTQVDAYRDATRLAFQDQPYRIESNGYGLHVTCTRPSCLTSATLNPEMFMREHTAWHATEDEIEAMRTAQEVPAPTVAEEIARCEYTALDVARLVAEAQKATSVKDDRAIVDALQYAYSEDVPWFDFVAQGARDSHNDSDDYEVVQSLIFYGTL